MGTGYAEGPDRAMNAVNQALESPLLDSSSIRGTKDILLNIISGTEEITMSEIGEIIDYLQDEAGQDATIIWGNGTDAKLGDQISVTIIATGFDVNPNRLFQAPVETVELEPEEFEFEINLGEDNLFDVPEKSVPNNEPIKQTQVISAKTKKKTKKDKSEHLGEAIPENVNVDNWFFKQFTKFFDDKEKTDTPIEGNNNN